MNDTHDHKLDQRLVAAILRGDAAAAREFWGRHGSALLAYAESISRGAAEDAVQSVFCRLLSLRGRVASEIDDWRAYLAKAVRHEILNRIREDRRRTARDTGSPRRALNHGLATDMRTDLVKADAIGAALECLPRRLREVVVLRHSAGLSFDQIAVAIGCNRNTLASRYSSAVRIMKEMISRGIGEHARSEVPNV